MYWCQLKPTLKTNKLPNKVKFTSPFGVAKYPHISSPDTKGKYADNKYKTKLVLPIDDAGAVAFQKHIDDAASEIHGAKGASMYKPYEVDEEAGEITFTFKTQYAPAVFDSRGKPAKGVMVGGGSVVRVMGQLVEFDKGISAQFNQVQIKELNGFGVCGFDAVEDGYAYSPDDVTESFSNNTNDTGGDNAAALDI